MTSKLFGQSTAQLIDLRSAHIDRLAGRILDAFNTACDLEDLDSAQDLLKVAETMLSRDGVSALKHWGRTTQSLVDAHFRLWEMRHLVR